MLPTPLALLLTVGSFKEVTLSPREQRMEGTRGREGDLEERGERNRGVEGRTRGEESRLKWREEESLDKRRREKTVVWN